MKNCSVSFSVLFVLLPEKKNIKIPFFFCFDLINLIPSLVGFIIIVLAKDYNWMPVIFLWRRGVACDCGHCTKVTSLVRLSWWRILRNLKFFVLRTPTYCDSLVYYLKCIYDRCVLIRDGLFDFLKITNLLKYKIIF